MYAVYAETFNGDVHEGVQKGVMFSGRGQGDLWGDPGHGTIWQGPPPGSTEAALPGNPPPEEAPTPAFDLEQELEALEKQTKVCH